MQSYINRFLWLVLALGAGVSVQAVSTPNSRSTAAQTPVIGNPAYKSDPLRNPMHDAQDMGDKLLGLGFVAIERSNLGIQQLGSTLREFRAKLAPAGVALVYYAGHGLQIKPVVVAQANAGGAAEVAPRAALERTAAATAQRAALERLAGQIIKDCPDCPELVVIPSGSFTMGSSAAEQALANAGGVPETFTSRESPQHTANIRSFAAGRYAISKGEFAAFVRAKGYQTQAEQEDGCFAWTGQEWKKDKAYNWRNVGFAQADNHPVVCVSWNDAQAYAQWISHVSGKTFRLLSESEREYVARAGTQTAFWWGDSITTSQANYDGTATSYNGSPKGEYRQATVPVSSFAPNPFGLYNVHGNAWEWVEDCFHETYSGAPTDGSAWTTGCSDNARMLRGGSGDYDPSGLRSAIRGRFTPDIRNDDFGFRLARTLFTP